MKGNSSLSRRCVLIGSATIVATTLSGCSGNTPSEESSDTRSETPTEGESTDSVDNTSDDGSSEETANEQAGIDIGDGNWAAVRGDPANTARSVDATPPTAEPTPEWSFNVGGYSLRPTVYGGTVFVGNYNGEQLYAVDATNGTEQWSIETGFSNIYLQATDEVLLVAGQTEGPLAVDPNSGNERWSLEYQLIAAPVALGDRVLLPAKSGLVSVDLTTGQDRVELLMERNVVQKLPAVTDGTAFVPATEGRLLAVSLDSGGVMWESDLGGECYVPSVMGETVYAHSSEEVVALRADTGKRLWTAEDTLDSTTGALQQSPAVDEQRVYISGRHEGEEVEGLVATARATGEFSWGIDTSSIITGPVVADGTVYTGEQAGSSSGGGLRAVEANDGSERWRWAPVGGNGAAVFEPNPVGNALFVSTRDNSLYALTE
jgi:outer membrane protein assembly factor BamB